MKPHLVIKLRERLREDTSVPMWQDFIRDKSRVRESMTPEVDRLLGEAGVEFWVTKEYAPAAAAWSPEEMREGLDRTYRAILKDDYDLPATLISRIRLVPLVEDARGLHVGEAELPAGLDAEA